VAVTERQLGVTTMWSTGATVPMQRAAVRSMSGRDELSSERSGSPWPRPAGGTGGHSGVPLSLLRAPACPRGFMPSDDELLERTLAFSGSYVSADGNVTVRRIAGDGFEYSGHRFLGNCTVCSRASLIPLTGEPLPDVREALLFVAAHDHGESD
jgi:hypothetical protein